MEGTDKIFAAFLLGLISGVLAGIFIWDRIVKKVILKKEKDKSLRDIDFYKQKVRKLEKENESLKIKLKEKQQEKTIHRNHQSKTGNSKQIDNKSKPEWQNKPVEKQQEKITGKQQEKQQENAKKPTTPPKPKIKTLYFTIPKEEGIFHIRNAKETPNYECYYKIEYKENENTGTLYYIGRENDPVALEQYQYYILRACENISSKSFRKATKIKQIKPGKVRRINDHWEIIEKIQIEVL